MRLLATVFFVLAIGLAGVWLLRANSAPDPETTLLRYGQAISDRDVEAAVRLFDERALLVRPPLQSTGTEQVREWLQFQVSQLGRIQITEYRVVGERVVYRFRPARNAGRRVGQGPDELTAEATIRNGRITSLETPARADALHLLAESTRFPARDPEAAPEAPGVATQVLEYLPLVGSTALTLLAFGMLALPHQSAPAPFVPVDETGVGPKVAALRRFHEARTRSRAAAAS